MSLPTVIVIGAVLGGLEGATIFFEPREPYKWQIVCAATLGGVLVALLTAFSVTASTRWWYAMVIGAFYGFAFALVVYLAKGGPKIGRRAICDPERRYQGWNYWTPCRHVGDQDDLANR